MQEHNDIFSLAVPGFIILIIAETIFLIKEHGFSKYAADFKVSAVIGIGFITISFFSKGIIIIVYQTLYAHRLSTLSTNGFFIWTACFVADDFTYYWYHRLSHQVRILWASHAVHHSAEIYSLSSAGARHTWTGNLTGTFLFWAWMPLIGFEPGMVMLIKSLSLTYQFCIHTEAVKKMPLWFEAIFNTPSHHRVHHGSNLIYLDKNYGGVLIVWDRFFGTYQKEKLTPAYGLTKKIKTTNALNIVFFEWKNVYKDLKKSKCLNDRWKYIFKPPGWSSDGKTKTTQQLRDMQKASKQILSEPENSFL